MRDDLVRRRLSEANPWWAAAAVGGDATSWSEHDLLLIGRSTYDVGYRSSVLDDLAAAPVGNTLTLLQGPRRVGKSVVVRELVLSLCKRPDVDPRQIINLACDGMTAQDITRVIKLGRELTRSVDVPQRRRRVWLFDEITSIKGWATALKHARDNSDFAHDTVVATGSSWRAEEDIEGNLFAGRAGTAGLRRLRQMFPLSFREYVQTVRPNLPVPDRIHPALLMSPGAAAVLEGLTFAIDDYDLAWQAYLSSGGFPRAVHAVETTGGHDRSYLEDLHAWLRRDVDADGPQESIVNLLAAVNQRSTSPFDRAGTAERLGYSTKQVFERRLARLVGSFGAVWCPQRNGHGRIVPNTQAKLYLVDPVLAWIPHILSAGQGSPDFTALTEQVLGVGLARTIDDLDPGRWIAGDTVGYGRTASGNEVDLAPVSVSSPAGTQQTVAMESKWVDSGWRKEALTIEGKYDGGILATKTIIDLRHAAWAVPAPMLAVLLG